MSSILIAIIEMELGIRWLRLSYAILIVLLVHINASFSMGYNNPANATARCPERERDALLAIKGDLIDECNLLSSWGTSEDCCGWERVFCDPHTGHVVQLHLNGSLDELTWNGLWKLFEGNISPKIIELQYLEYLDLSNNIFTATQIPPIICSLSNLRHLDLHYNNLNGSKMLELMGNLSKLRYLDLSYIYLEGEIPAFIGSLSNLRHLDLRWNGLTGSKTLELVGNMTRLRYLDLSCAFLYGDTLGILYGDHLKNLTHLQYLNLADFPFSTLNGGILNWLPHLSSLKYLDMSGTNLSKATDWLETINKLPNLQELTLIGCDLPPPILSDHINSSLSPLVRVDLSYNRVTSLIFKWSSNYNTTLEYLDLSSNQLSGSIPDVFANMSSLTHLHLSYNSLSGFAPNAFVNMRSLGHLDLSFNQLSGSIPDSFSNLSSLVDLDLSNNKLEGGLISIAQICSLKYLSISNCNLAGKLSESIRRWSTCPKNPLLILDLSNNDLVGPFPDFTNFPSLEVLYLSNNKLSGRIPESIGQLLLLKDLDLSRNLLSGNIPHIIRNQSSLEKLNLGENQLSGRIPEGIGELSNLHFLDLSRNWLRGRLPQSIGQLSNLEHLNLSMNNFKGKISETHFTKLHSLNSLDFSSNSLLEFNFSVDWIPPFQYLHDLHLRSCKVGPNFPKWLRTQKEYLLVLDMSSANISDVIPSWFWDIVSNGSSIDLSNNQIRGRLESSQALSSSGLELRLSSNHLEGPIPSFLSYASYLDLSDNQFSSMTSFICSSNVKICKFLDLSKNHILGEVPDCWRKWANLYLLDLSFNAFSGKIPQSMGYLNGINTLKLRRNNLVGELPSSLKNCTSLNVIDVGYNNLSGSVPQWVGVSLPNLVILMLQFNQIGGSLPSQLCKLAHLQILDVSVNQIYGRIPKCFKNLTSLVQEGNSNLTIRHFFPEADAPASTPLYYDDDETFNWKGAQSSYKSTLGLVKRIDLSSNRLSGEIPTEITCLVGLVSLDLSRNHLTGQIPLDIGNLKSLDSLDLSRNMLLGEIPISLAHIDRLGFMDLSHNNLSGEIPTGTQLQGFSASSYMENPLLCGLPLDVCNPEGNGQNKVSSGEEDADELITQGFYISLGLGFAFGFWGICGSLIFKRSWRYAYYKFINGMNDWLYVKVVLIRQKLKNMLHRQQS